MSSTPLKFLAVLAPAVVLAAAACGPSAEVRAKLAALDTVSAQKDSLLQEMALQTRLLSDVAAEIAEVQVKDLQVSTESADAAHRDSMVLTIRHVVTRLDESERRLRQTQSRVRNLTRLSDSLRTTLEETMANLEGVIESQKTTIAVLAAEIDTLQTQNVALQTENEALKDTVTSENAVFYTIGTKDELKEKGIVVEEGGSRVLFILWRTGETLSPARDLDPTLFTAIDRRETTEIPLPNATGRYRIVSRQDLQYLETARDDKGRVTGAESLRIASPAEFWRASKYLIVVQEDGGNPQQGD